MQAKEEWSEMLNVLRKKPHQTRILYPIKLSFKSERELETFWDKQKWREFFANRIVLQEILRSSERRKMIY